MTPSVRTVKGFNSDDAVLDLGTKIEVTSKECVKLLKVIWTVSFYSRT